jgi:MoaA/NifB/PqqE/SkfB family radical SAM enzyme
MEKFLSIHVTDLCNSTCSFCVVASPLYTKDTIQYADIVRFLEENAGQGWEAVNLHGGEATIHPKFIEILEHIRRLNYPEVHLQTNAIKLANEEFAAKVAGLGVKKFIISLHGDQPEMQDSQTGTPGGFAKTIKGIQNVKAHGVHVRTNTVITWRNLARLSNICQLACELGVDHVNLSNMHPVGSALYARSTAMPTFSAMQEEVYRSVDVVVAHGRTITLEGFPYCVIRDRIDHQLNNEVRRIRMLMRGDVVEDYDQFMCDVMRIFGPPCEGCSLRQTCGGVYPQYIDYNGWAEFSPFVGPAPALQPATLQPAAALEPVAVHQHGD